MTAPTQGINEPGTSFSIKVGADLPERGSDADFSHPSVLTYPASSVPADVPRPQPVTQALATSSDGAVFDSQLWSADVGVLP
jgi:hypothetical protein